MVTQLGPASISLTLDTKSAIQNLDRLEKRIRDIGKISDRQVDERNQEEQKQESTGQQLQQKVEKVQQQARAGRFGSTGAKLAVSLGAVTGVALLAETVLASTAAGLKSAYKDDESLTGSIKKELAEFVARQLEVISDKITEVRSYIGSVFPTIDQLKDISRSKLLLGENPTTGIADIAQIFFKVNQATSLADRQKDKLLPEAIGRFIGEMMSGGAKR